MKIRRGIIVALGVLAATNVAADESTDKDTAIQRDFSTCQRKAQLLETALFETARAVQREIELVSLRLQAQDRKSAPALPSGSQ